MAADSRAGSAKFKRIVKRCLLGSSPAGAYDISSLADQAPVSLENKKHVITIGTGRCGMRWLCRFFSRHQNCVGSAERFIDYDAFYRWATWYGVDVDMAGYFELMRRAAFADLKEADITIYTGHYLTFTLAQACSELKPTHLIYMVRQPEAVVNSLYIKGWYKGDLFDHKSGTVPGPQPLMSPSIHRSLGRIMPKDEYYEEWLGLSRIGKIAWFYVMMNEAIQRQLPELTGVKVWTVKLSDLDQNYDYYNVLADEFDFSPRLSRSDFLAEKGKTNNQGKSKRLPSDWSTTEREDFDNIVGPFQDNYTRLTTTGL